MLITYLSKKKQTNKQTVIDGGEEKQKRSKREKGPKKKKEILIGFQSSIKVGVLTCSSKFFLLLHARFMLSYFH